LSDQKIILCYTGEPRSFRKSLRNRNKALDKYYKNKYNIQSNYLIYFSPSQSSRNKDLIFNKIKYLGEDKFLNNIILENKKYGENIYKYILEQKYRLLKLSIESNKLDKNDLIVLTRTDWLFTYETRKLIDCSKKENKIVTPFISDQLYEHFGIEYKGLFDQIIIIPGNLGKEMLNALDESIKFCNYQVPKKTKNLMAGGNGMNRFGLTPEQLLGLGFSKCNLWESQKSIEIKYSYPANMYNASRHNLIRHDAHVWMNLSLNDIFTKYFIWYLKPLIVIKIKNFLKVLNIKKHN
tara:strand:+ start:547 stop:1428 length:882 start_codon:yes stop_codon:yes gene_type:complete